MAREWVWLQCTECSDLNYRITIDHKARAQLGVRPGMVAVQQALEGQLQGYEMLVMNVRSYTFPFAYKAAQEFKKVNPQSIVLAGGMHDQHRSCVESRSPGKQVYGRIGP